ncbi:MAG TPA: Tad domain-containing protein [Pyrinomonadaceae bacterium]|nr:Tad domain-containing protein [Pyrinomonadaceae bacterium]
MKSEREMSGRDSERGSVLAVSAFGMLAFLLAVGLCVDISHFYVVKAELQNAADASSLAGASALNSSPGGVSNAVDRAVASMNGYEFNNKGVSINPEDVLFSKNFGGPYVSAAEAQAEAADIRFVSVRVPAVGVGVFFASLATGRDTEQIGAEAVAGMSVAPNVFCDWIPLTVIDDPAAPMQPGQVYTIRAAPQNSVSAGNYQVLAVAGRGGQDAREGIAKGVNECAEPGAVYEIDTKPGVNSGPARAGINTRFDEYASQTDPLSHPPDVNVKENITWEQYRNAVPGSTNWQSPRPGHGAVPLRRVVLIPLVRQDEFDQGRNVVRFDRFGAFFLRTRASGGNGGDIVAEFIEERLVFGRGGYKPGGGPVNPALAQPVLYR